MDSSQCPFCKGPNFTGPHFTLGLGIKPKESLVLLGIDLETIGSVKVHGLLGCSARLNLKGDGPLATVSIELMAGAFDTPALKEAAVQAAEAANIPSATFSSIFIVISGYPGTYSNPTFLTS